MEKLVWGIVFVLGLQTVTAYYTFVSPGERLCYMEDMAQDMKLSLEWKVELPSSGEEGEFLGLTLSVTDPAGNKVDKFKKLDSKGRREYSSKKAGEYTFCFEFTRRTWGSPKFDYRFHIDIETGAEAIDYDQLANSDELSNFQVMLKHLSNQLKTLTKQQRYARDTAVEHVLLAQDTYDQIIYWSIVETLILIGLAFYQLSHLKKFFKSKKLV
mmetsp:Transcript_18207/g.51389  ORF Transcript_18207/g.51389 Transcript_18207/m.51389 type:complete len:213 (+) Transcript_18207:166-804(+)|eukprot:CAMPEP_0119122764 /NCGR_PEP_ID=MMETSP1310-20130426/2929_1 /TAXON_ID=464262 /ORGANISM="Genus nov. species nov., Strain RCC2339" /LENGTH=212 /DNA_ID=CAMNT_0007112475 /DNA_START=172 /DNA_END=810 /DNA_ORIENTATION=+